MRLLDNALWILLAATLGMAGLTFWFWRTGDDRLPVGAIVTGLFLVALVTIGPSLA